MQFLLKTIPHTPPNLRQSLTYWCVDEVQEVLLALVGVKQGGSLGFHRYPPLSLHLKLVQHLFVLVSLCYGTCNI